MIDNVNDNEALALSLGLLDSTAVFMEHAGQNICGNQFGIDTVRELRYKLLYEEYNEYVRGEIINDLTETVDGLLDIIVVAWGTLLAYIGEDKALAAAAEVARSNLDKVVGEGLPIRRADGKVLKPEGWRGPDIAGAIA